MDRGTEEELQVLVLSPTQSHMLLHLPKGCNDEGVVRDFWGPQWRGFQLLMWNYIWESTRSLRPAVAPILQPCECGLLMTYSCLSSLVNWPWPMESWLTGGGNVLPPKHRGGQWAWLRDMEGHDPSPLASRGDDSVLWFTLQSPLWFYLRSQACLVLSPCNSFFPSLS